MSIFLFLNTISLLFVIVYGLSLGLRNWFLRLLTLFNSKTLVISTQGKIFDYLFLVLIIYFSTYGFPFFEYISNIDIGYFK